MDPYKLLLLCASDMERLVAVQHWVLPPLEAERFPDVLASFADDFYRLGAARTLVKLVTETTPTMLTLCCRQFNDDNLKSLVVGVLAAKITTPFTTLQVARVVAEVANTVHKFKALETLLPCMEPLRVPALILSFVMPMDCEYSMMKVVGALCTHVADTCVPMTCRETRAILDRFPIETYKLQALCALRSFIAVDNDLGLILHAFQSHEYVDEAFDLLPCPIPPVERIAAADSSKARGPTASSLMGADDDTGARIGDEAEELRELREEVARAKEERAVALAMKTSLEDQLASRPVVIEGGGDASQDSPKCVVCLDAAKCALLDKCDHVSLCEECARAIMKRGELPCPICRVPSTGWRRIYL